MKSIRYIIFGMAFAILLSMLFSSCEIQREGGTSPRNIARNFGGYK